MQYKGKNIVDVPSAGTKYVPVVTYNAEGEADRAVTDIVVAADSLYTQIGDGIYLWKEAEGPAIIPYLSFAEENSEPFTLKTYNTSKNWDGTLYYSTDAESWNEWDGEEISSSDDGKLYVRGKNNTKITGSGSNKQFVLTSNKRIQCLGDIENLLDYETAEQGNHPVMADNCYGAMFFDCTSLTQAPELPATTLTKNCYNIMFSGCIFLKKAPELPATTLADGCYNMMFYNCTYLTQAPELPATTLTKNCYNMMFYNCTYLTQAPELPATTLADGCYNMMFLDCYYLTGQIHCASSTAEDSNKLKASDIRSSSATIVFDL